jgi:Tol biopolymer transport system component
MSANGRVAAWDSYATDFVADDTNGSEDVFARDLVSGETVRVSVASDGTQADLAASDPAVSGDGRFVAFSSDARNLVAGDTNAKRDVFVHDLLTGTTERVSISSADAQANNTSVDPALSYDGRFVAFISYASNLVDADRNLYPDIYVHDRVTGTTEVVSVDSEGNVADGGALYPDIASNGRYIAFSSSADALVPGDANGRQDVFVHDRQTGETEIVSISTDGVAGNRDSREPSISDDGRRVSFTSFAATLVPLDANGAADIFVRDRTAGTTRRVSATSSGAEAMSGGTPFAPGSFFASLSPDGRYVAYQSDAPNLMEDDTPDFDVFIHDLVTGSTTPVAHGLDGLQPDKGAGLPEIGPDGRHVAFLSDSTNLVAEGNDRWDDMFVHDRGPSTGVGGLSAEVVGGSVNAEGWATFSGAEIAALRDPTDDAIDGTGSLGGELSGVSIAYRPESGDLFARWEVTELPAARTNAAGAPGVVHGISFQVDGTDYELRAMRIGATGVPPGAPLFAIYRCDPHCLQIERLDGGYGATGFEISTSVELSSLSAVQGDVLSDIVAYAGAGEAATPAAARFDEVALGDVPIPRTRIEIGIAPVGSAPGDVVFDSTVQLVDGRFSFQRPLASLVAGGYDLWARGCLGDRCGAASTPITIGATTPSPTDTPTESPSSTGSPSSSPSESPQPDTTTVAFTDLSAESGQHSDETFFEARLTDADGDPVSGAELIFELAGEESERSFTATTDENGVASVTPILDEKPGPHQLTVRYAGDDARGGSADATTFVVDKEDTDLELTVAGNGNNRTLKARLSDRDTPSHGVADRTIDFYADGELIGSGTTDEDGIATLKPPPRYRGGKHDFEARFEGDDHYLRATDRED